MSSCSIDVENKPFEYCLTGRALIEGKLKGPSYSVIVNPSSQTCLGAGKVTKSSDVIAYISFIGALQLQCNAALAEEVDMRVLGKADGKCEPIVGSGTEDPEYGMLTDNGDGTFNVTYDCEDDKCANCLVVSMNMSTNECNNAAMIVPVNEMPQCAAAGFQKGRSSSGGVVAGVVVVMIIVFAGVGIAYFKFCRGGNRDYTSI